MKTYSFQRKSFRLRGYNYSSDGAYFLTICTKNRVEYFGEIRNQIMGLNESGCIATKFWQEIPEHFENVVLDEFVVMPDHVHGVIFIKNVFHPRRDVAMQHPTGVTAP